jgi:Mg2+-importing ATPase
MRAMAETGLLGLTSAQAQERLRRDGPNTVATAGARTRLAILFAQFKSPLVLLLVGASLVSGITGDPIDAGIILAIVTMSAVLGFVQEARSQDAAEALRLRVAVRARTLRDGAWTEVPVRDLVVGDIIEVRAGNIVPADARLISANHLYVDESALTGESYPAAKQPPGSPGGVPATAALAPGAPTPGAPTPGASAPTPSVSPAPSQESASAPDQDQAAQLFAGTSVVGGDGVARITATGPRTSFGHIASRLAERAPETDFRHGVTAFGLLVARLTLVLVVFVFAVNVALQRPLLDALLFSVALAVGLTPELLPAIVTLNLTKGARALAGYGVIVKRLPAIQNFGSMDVLCTDKTGTLTTGKLTLRGSYDAAGVATPRPLALGRCNSRLQTGFENPLDAALVAAPLASGEEELGLSDAQRVAEIPFDFVRRRLGVAVARPGQGGALLIVKGAPEDVLAVTTTCRLAEGSTSRIDAPARQVFEEQLRRFAGDGVRVVAVASREFDDAALAAARASGFGPQVERDLVLEGLLAFDDPPKADVSATLADLAARRVELKIVTGDDELVARHVCAEVGLPVKGTMSGAEIDALPHQALLARVEQTTIFARVDPDHKRQIIAALRARGHVVGYLGDGINDAPSLHTADVGISVDNATDVARAAADLILLEPGLEPISNGVAGGRSTFENTLKYIRMGTSSNFGNMISVAGASLILPFLPLLPVQILLNNLIYDISQTTIPTDEVDEEVLAHPAHWDIREIRRFMLVFGPLSSLFDYLTFFVLLVPLAAASNPDLFRSGWFVESMATQVLVIFVIRTRAVPFWHSRSSRPLRISMACALAGAAALPMLPVADRLFGFSPLPALFWPALVVLVGSYLAAAELVKRHVFRSALAGSLRQGQERVASRPGWGSWF